MQRSRVRRGPAPGADPRTPAATGAAAGRGGSNPAKIENEAAFREVLERHAAQAGWNPPTWYETTVDDPGHAMARTALDNGVDLVVAAGGDGTYGWSARSSRAPASRWGSCR